MDSRGWDFSRGLWGIIRARQSRAVLLQPQAAFIFSLEWLNRNHSQDLAGKHVDACALILFQLRYITVLNRGKQRDVSAGLRGKPPPHLAWRRSALSCMRPEQWELHHSRGVPKKSQSQRSTSKLCNMTVSSVSFLFSDTARLNQPWHTTERTIDEVNHRDQAERRLATSIMSTLYAKLAHSKGLCSLMFTKQMRVVPMLSSNSRQCLSVNCTTFVRLDGLFINHIVYIITHICNTPFNTT